MEQIQAVSPPLRHVRRPDLDHRIDPTRRPGADRLAVALGVVLRCVPDALAVKAGSRFPLLDALLGLDARQGTDLAFRLQLVATVLHVDADERWVAEYLLRHRREIRTGRRTAERLLMAARCAAAMKVKHDVERELPTGIAADAFADLPHGQLYAERSVPDVVVAFAERMVCYRLAPPMKDAIADATCVALELSERHALQGGAGPSVIAMRTKVKPEARLALRLQREMPRASAGPLARTLVGPDRAAIETSLLWWVATGGAPAAVPAEIRSRWVRDLRRAECALAENRGTCPHARVG